MVTRQNVQLGLETSAADQNEWVCRGCQWQHVNSKEKPI